MRAIVPCCKKGRNPGGIKLAETSGGIWGFRSPYLCVLSLLLMMYMDIVVLYGRHKEKERAPRTAAVADLG